jgi:adenylate cyclase
MAAATGEARGRSARVTASLVEAAVSGQDLPTLLDSLSRALVEVGVPLARSTAGAFLLHPLLDATLVIWRRGRGALVDDTPRPAVRGEEAWRGSPFHRLLLADERVLRRRLERGEGTDAHPVLAGLAAEGATDYLALRTGLGARVALGGASDFYSSWATDRPGGFADEDMELIRELAPLAAFVFASALNADTTRTLLATYLGADAASRVLGGDIERGRVEMIHAVIWYSDLAGFTRLTDKVSRAGMLQLFSGHAEILGLLNDYAEILVDAIEARGGQVLKFMGDGILAIFRADSDEDACEAALSAWAQASGLCGELGRRRVADGVAATHPYLALHAGEVLYGNVGGRARLDFTVLGPAVNEASRIAALCRSLDQPAILSEAFAAACPADRRERLVRLGRYALRGVAEPQMLFTPEPSAPA